MIGWLLAPAALAQVGPDEGVLTKLTGNATTTVGGVATAATRGSVVPIGATVCTQPDSYATVRLAASAATVDHHEVTLFSETCITMVRSEVGAAGRSSTLSLESGHLTVRPASISGGEVEIDTASGQTTGSSGGYRVAIEEGASRTEAVTGPVLVAAAGVELQLPSGFGSRVYTGQPPSAPVPLLVPSDALVPSDGAPLLRPEFEWGPVERALGYRLEVSTDPDFTGLVLVDEVPQAEWNPELLFLPFRVPGLWWRVASFDRTGFVGIDSAAHEIAFPAGVGP
jgi:hypothetical protein